MQWDSVTYRFTSFFEHHLTFLAWRFGPSPENGVLGSNHDHKIWLRKLIVELWYAYPLVSSNIAGWKLFYEWRFHSEKKHLFQWSMDSSQPCLMTPEATADDLPWEVGLWPTAVVGRAAARGTTGGTCAGARAWAATAWQRFLADAMGTWKGRWRGYWPGIKSEDVWDFWDFWIQNYGDDDFVH